MKLKHTLIAGAGLLAFAATGQAAVTLTGRNFTTPTSGVALVDSGNNLLAAGSGSWTAGTFAAGFNFNVTATQVIAGFNAVTTTAGIGTPFAGTFNNSVTYDGGTTATPASVVGQAVYILVGNGLTLATSTQIAVFTTGGVFIGGDAIGNGGFTADAETVGKVVYGQTGGAPNTQPNGAFNLTNSVRLISAPVPEPSTMMLGAIGALGLLRRRR